MDQSTFLLTLALLHLAQATDCQGDKCTGECHLKFPQKLRPFLSSKTAISSKTNTGTICLCLVQSFKTGLIITGGSGTETTIETLPADSNCSIPPFPSQGKPILLLILDHDQDVQTKGRYAHSISVINDGTTLVACGGDDTPNDCISWRQGQAGWEHYADLR